MLKTYEFTLRGFDASTDETDHLVKWVTAPSKQVAVHAADASDWDWSECECIDLKSYAKEPGIDVVCDPSNGPLSPLGWPIRGTLDTIPGVALISSIERSRDGTLDINYEGETKVDWDDQKTVERNGRRVYVDVAGYEWTEDQVVLPEDMLQQEDAA